MLWRWSNIVIARKERIDRRMHAAAPLPMSLGESDLRRIEQALLDALLDVRPTDANALDRLLSDPKFSHAGREDVQRFLTAATMDNRSDRNRALDRLFGDASAPQPLAAHA